MISRRGPPASLSPGALMQVACLLEVSAPKPGNVHPGRGFEDMGWLDFAVAAAAAAPAFDRATERPLGDTVLDAVRASRDATGKNVNLGTILLIAPLAATTGSDLREGVRRLLGLLGPRDAEAVYEAIRIASPGGLGDSAEADVRGPAPADLVEAMRLAEGRDLVARQYARGFEDLFDTVLPALERALGSGLALPRAVVKLHLEVLRRFPDSLIARKCGLSVAEEASRRASEVLAAGWPETPGAEDALRKLDDWLRADGNRRNPGTTADLIAAALFAALRAGIISLPC